MYHPHSYSEVFWCCPSAELPELPEHEFQLPLSPVFLTTGFGFSVQLLLFHFGIQKVMLVTFPLKGWQQWFPCIPHTSGQKKKKFSCLIFFLKDSSSSVRCNSILLYRSWCLSNLLPKIWLDDDPYCHIAGLYCCPSLEEAESHSFASSNQALVNKQLCKCSRSPALPTTFELITGANPAAN